MRPQVLIEEQNMYVIDKEIPGAVNTTPEQLKVVSQNSCGVLNNLGS